jgi:hypothetical protein
MPFWKKKKKKPKYSDVELAAIKSLNDILAKRYYPEEEGSWSPPLGMHKLGGESISDGQVTARYIDQFETPEGRRYYPGEARFPDSTVASDLASLDAAERALHAPADSISTEVFNILQSLDDGLFIDTEED